MSNNSQKNNRVTNSVLRMAVGKLILYEAIFSVAIVVAFFCGDWFFRHFCAWRYSQLICKIVYAVNDNLFLVMFIIWIIGAVTIVIVHNYRLARYFQNMTDAANLLVSEDETPIKLPTPLQQVELQLNRIKIESMRNAHAAKESEQRKNDLIVYLAHDLKTPLTSVIGYLTLLQDEKDISQELQDKYAGIALDKATRLEDLINEFFEITRFNLTYLTLETETVNLTRMLEQITFEFNPILKEKGLTWVLNIPPNMELICDPDKLERVFDNLIRNAVNYSYPNSTISVSAYYDKDIVIIRFVNSGRTIPIEKLRRLFEQFYRMDTSRTSKTGGAGLGLAIAKDIVTLHGGLITADSSDEKVTFTIQLPRNCKKIV